MTKVFPDYVWKKIPICKWITFAIIEEMASDMYLYINYFFTDEKLLQRQYVHLEPDVLSNKLLFVCLHNIFPASPTNRTSQWIDFDG